MDLQDILSSLAPINTKEKVEAIVQQMENNDIEMNQTSDMAIRYAIKKMSVQLYYIDKYGNQWAKVEDRLEKRKAQERAKIEQEKQQKLEAILIAKRDKAANKMTKPKEKSKKKKRKFKSFGTTADSMMRVFGGEFKMSRKGINQIKTDNRKKTYPIETVNSVRAISIPLEE